MVAVLVVEDNVEDIADARPILSSMKLDIHLLMYISATQTHPREGERATNCFGLEG